MGQVKQHMLDQEYNSDLTEFLKELIDREEINDVPLGIAKQVVDKGVDSMSEKQKIVIEGFVESYKKDIVCERCSNGNVSNLTDYISIKDNTWDLCPMCQYDKEQFMKD
jgi:hypothetical protein